MVRGIVRWMVVATALALGSGLARADDAPARRAFVVGVQNYSDPAIQQLKFPEADATGVAADLADIGFDKKNVTLVTGLRAKADFDKKFKDFLATVKEGDTVFFYFSGHGAGIEATRANYLLLGGLKSLFAYTRDQMAVGDKNRQDVISVKMPDYVGAYENDEIARNGLAVADVIAQIAAKRPKLSIVVLDACRSLANPDKETAPDQNDAFSGSRLLPTDDLPASTFVLYSASFGEQAVESFANRPGQRGNSLFTEAFRSELQRPGQTLPQLGERLRLVVRAFAKNGGRQQDPEYFQNLADQASFAIVDSVGAERFQLAQDDCAGSEDDLALIEQRPDREKLERHRRRFENCPTAEKARRELVLLLNAQRGSQTTDQRSAGDALDPCDTAAAGYSDPSRPSNAPFVPLEKIDWAAAIKTCEESSKNDPREPRFIYAQARAEQAAALSLPPDDPARKLHVENAREDYKDAQKLGSVPALFGLATLFAYSDASDDVRDEAAKQLKQAAEAGFVPAEYLLGQRYRDGSEGVEYNEKLAHYWIDKAAKELPEAKVEAAEDLWSGRGVASENPRAAVSALEQAANDSGSTDAKLKLGLHYYFGKTVYDSVDGKGAKDAKVVTSSKTLLPDKGEALLWFARAAADGDPSAQFNLAFMMDDGDGLPGPQPEIAERYYRLAAHGGDSEAEITLAERLINGKAITRPENGEREAIDLLIRAMNQGSAQAALDLARVYREGQVGQKKDAVKAMQYAYRAIDLSTKLEPIEQSGNAFYEINAGILLSEMAVNGEAVDSATNSDLLTHDEVDRLEHFYGTVNASAHRVLIRQLKIPLNCGSYTIDQYLWVWDWGRSESPTEPQFRTLEQKTQCYNNFQLRSALSNAFVAAKQGKLPFADLISTRIAAAQSATQKR